MTEPVLEIEQIAYLNNGKLLNTLFPGIDMKILNLRPIQ